MGEERKTESLLRINFIPMPSESNPGSLDVISVRVLWPLELPRLQNFLRNHSRFYGSDANRVIPTVSRFAGPILANRLINMDAHFVNMF